MCFHRHQEGLQQDLACSFLGNPEEVQLYSTNCIHVIKYLCDKATSAVLFSGSKGDWFQTTVGFQQGCVLSPTVFNIFLERIMTDALENHKGTVNIGDSTTTDLHFTDDINGLAGKEELARLIEHLNKAFTVYGMEISAKTRMMTT